MHGSQLPNNPLRNDFYSLTGEDMFAEFFKDFSAVNAHDNSKEIVSGEIPLSESHNQSAINLPFSCTDK